jgi:ABC-type amino acid transport substrate-binding protein
LTQNCCSSSSAYLIARGSKGGGREDLNGYQIGTIAGTTIEGHNAYLESIQLQFNVFEFSLQKEGCMNVPH